MDEDSATSPGASGSQTASVRNYAWPKDLADLIVATEKRAQDMELLATIEKITNPGRRLADL